MSTPQIFVHIQQEVDFTIFDTKWIPRSCRFVALGTNPRGTGAIRLYELDGNEVRLQKKIEKAKPIKCGTFGAASCQTRELATGNFEGRLEIWDLENCSDPVYTVSGHKSIINCIDGTGGLSCGFGAPELLTGGKDGVVRVWDPRQKDEPVVSIEPTAVTQVPDCWTVAFGNSFSNDTRYVCAGYDNGDIKMIDLRTVKVQWETNVKSGVCCIEFDRKDIKMNKLVATTLDSKFFIYDLRTQHDKHGFTHLSQTTQKGTVWTARHLPQNRDVFTTSGANGSISLWKYSYPSVRQQKDSDGAKHGIIGSVALLREVSISTQPISSLDWNADKRGLAVCSSFDQTLRVIVVTNLNLI